MEFEILTDGMALKQLNSATNTNHMHAREISVLQRFNFSIKHKPGQNNKVADALSRRNALTTILRAAVTEFECVKDNYDQDRDFDEIWKQCNENLSAS